MIIIKLTTFASVICRWVRRHAAAAVEKQTKIRVELLRRIIFWFCHRPPSPTVEWNSGREGGIWFPAFCLAVWWLYRCRLRYCRMSESLRNCRVTFDQLDQYRICAVTGSGVKTMEYRKGSLPTKYPEMPSRVLIGSSLVVYARIVYSEMAPYTLYQMSVTDSKLN